MLKIKEEQITDAVYIQALNFCANGGRCSCCKYGDCGKCPIEFKDTVALVNRLQSKIDEYEHKLKDGDLVPVQELVDKGELVSREWHDEQVMTLISEKDLLIRNNQALADEIVCQIEEKAELRGQVKQLEKILDEKFAKLCEV